MAGIRQNLPRPRKRWSQNFLKDPNIARKIARGVRLSSPSLIIEIGPGPGILTEALFDQCDRLIAIEIDPELVGELSTRWGHLSQFTVITRDFLQWDLAQELRRYPEHHIAIAGNLPYRITSPILFKTLEQADLVNQAVFMIQKEVAQRITARPAGKEYGILSVFCQFYARAEYLFTVPAHLFSPKPKVDSAVIRLNFSPDAEKRLDSPALFRTVVRTTFGQRRKMLRNTLSLLYPQTILHQLKTDLTRRPEQLSVEEFADLSNQLFHLQAGEGHVP